MIRIFGLVVIGALFVCASAQGNSLSDLTCEKSGLSQQAEGLSLPLCVDVCNRVFPQAKPEMKAFFEKRCQEEIQIRARSGLSGLAQNAVDVIDQALLQCLPQAGKKAIVGTWEFVTGLPHLIHQGLAAMSAQAARNQLPLEFAEAGFEACEKNLACKRTLARGLIQYRGISPDGQWETSDAQVEREVGSWSLNDILIQLQQHRQLTENECLSELSSLRDRIHREVRREGGEWGEVQQRQLYDQLATKAPYCPGALGIRPPELTPPAPEKKTPPWSPPEPPRTPLDRLSLREKIAVGQVCLGPAFTVEMCSEIVQVLVPIPLIGPQSKMLSSSARAESVGESLTTAARQNADQAADARVAIDASTDSSSLRALSPERTSFLDSYKARSFRTEAQNLSFIAAAKTADPAKSRFFDVENSVLKKLNDATNDKNLVTSLTNFQKEKLLGRLEALKARFPQYQFEIYDDFKSVKVAVQSPKNLSPEESRQLYEALNQLYRDTNLELAAEMKRLGIEVPAAGPPETWFKAGFGDSQSMASLGAREARQNAEAVALDTTTSQFRSAQNSQLAQIEAQRVALADSPRFQSLFESTGSSAGLPRQDVIDLVRKQSNPEKLAEQIRLLYDQPQFSAADAASLQGYLQSVDRFSPSLLVPRRVSVNLDEAEAGGLTADFLGLGSANLLSTAQALKGQREIAPALVSARQGEETVTRVFQRRMEAFKKIAGGDVLCSGDDCVKIATRAMSDREKVELLARLGRSSDARQVRVAFVGPQVPQAERLLIATQGETLEKLLRKELAGKVPLSKSQELVFGMDLRSVQAGEGQVSLLIGQSSRARLTAQEQAEIQAAFERAVTQFNRGSSHHATAEAVLIQTQLQLRAGPQGLILLSEPDSN